MGKILEFKVKQKQDPALVKLLQLSDEFDAVIVNALGEGKIESREIVGLLAHRLGTLLGRVDDLRKDELWEICSTIARREAGIRDDEDNAV